MNSNKQIENIDVENIIWLIYIVLIFLALLSNYYEKNGIINNNYKDKLDSKNINIVIFIVLLLIYIYFLLISYDKYKNDPNNINYTSLIGNIVNVISGLIFLYVSINIGIIEPI